MKIRLYYIGVLYYSIYIFFTILMYSYLDGIPLLGGLNMIGDAHIGVSFTTVLTYFGFMPLMSIYFVKLEKNKKLLRFCYSYLLFTILSSISLFIFHFDSYISFSFFYHNITILLGFYMVIYIGVKGLKSHKVLARSFLIAVSILIFTILISMLEDFGITAFVLFFDLVKFGSLIEVVILSLALALYFRDIKNDLGVKNESLDTLSLGFKAKKEEFSSLENRFLSSQMNPHFTFNAMNSILLYMLDNEVEKAQTYLTKYSKLIRKVFENNLDAYISISEEVKMLTLYLEMELYRFSEKFEFTISVSEGLVDSNYNIPPMLIQPYIENSIWHGFSTKLKGVGNIDVSFTLEEGRVKCTIIDNGIGRDKTKLNKASNNGKRSLGILITQQRINNLHADDNLKFAPIITDIYDNENTPIGTKVEVYLPTNN